MRTSPGPDDHGSGSSSDPSPERAPSDRSDSSNGRLTPFIILTFLGFFDVGLPIASLTSDVRELGFGTAAIVLVIALQSVVTVISRHRAGTLCDRKGARYAALAGFCAAAAAGLVYSASEWRLAPLAGSMALLIVGRILMGLAQSMMLTGVLSWAIGSHGGDRSWRILALPGGSMHVGLILGAITGAAIDHHLGSLSVAVATMLVPLAAIGLIVTMPVGSLSASGSDLSLGHALRRIFRPGVVLGVATLPMASMVGLLTPILPEESFERPQLLLAALLAGYVAARLVVRSRPSSTLHLPAIAAALAAEACGQILLLDGGRAATALGAFLTGLGYSLIFPLLGAAVLGCFDRDHQGRVIGGLSAFQDLAIGFALPLTGAVLALQGGQIPFVIGLVATLLALLLSITAWKSDLSDYGRAGYEVRQASRSTGPDA